MLMDIGNQIKIALKMLVCLTLMTGMIYPLTVTLFAQWVFPWQANGSLIEREGRIVGSMLIGQSFTSDHYFWGRPSATMPFPYNGGSSSGSNSGPSNPQFLATVKERAMHLMSTESYQRLIPVDLVTASASGLDPDMSPAAAIYQIPRVAKARHLSEKELHALVLSQIKGRVFGVLGEPRINVLQLNLALDRLGGRHG